MRSNKFEHIPVYPRETRHFKFLKGMRILTNNRKAIFAMNKEYKCQMLRLLPTSTEGNTGV